MRSIFASVLAIASGCLVAQAVAAPLPPFQGISVADEAPAPRGRVCDRLDWRLEGQSDGATGKWRMYADDGALRCDGDLSGDPEGFYYRGWSEGMADYFCSPVGQLAAGREGYAGLPACGLLDDDIDRWGVMQTRLDAFALSGIYRPGDGLDDVADRAQLEAQVQTACGDFAGSELEGSADIARAGMSLGGPTGDSACDRARRAWLVIADYGAYDVLRESYRVGYDVYGAEFDLARAEMDLADVQAIARRAERDLTELYRRRNEARRQDEVDRIERSIVVAERSRDVALARQQAAVRDVARARDELQAAELTYRRALAQDGGGRRAP